MSSGVNTEIVGQISKINQKIKINQAWNKGYLGWFVSDNWDNLETIKLSCFRVFTLEFNQRI